MWEQFKRIIKDNGLIVLTATQPFATDLINSNRKMFRYDIIWYKALGTGHLNCNRMPMRNHEHILVFYNKLPTYNPQMTKGKMREKGSKHGNTTSNYGAFKAIQHTNDLYYPQSVIDISNGDKTKENQHPTQKPVALFEYLIETYTNEGDTVFDACIGSGTTCIACINKERHYIGFEINEEYFKMASERVSSHKLLRKCED